MPWLGARPQLRSGGHHGWTVEMPIMTRVFSMTGTRFGNWRYEEAIFLANIAIADFLRNLGPRHEGAQIGTPVSCSLKKIKGLMWWHTVHLTSNDHHRNQEAYISTPTWRISFKVVTYHSLDAYQWYSIIRRRIPFANLEN